MSTDKSSTFNGVYRSDTETVELEISEAEWIRLKTVMNQGIKRMVESDRYEAESVALEAIELTDELADRYIRARYETEFEW